QRICGPYGSSVTAPSDAHTASLHDALPILSRYEREALGAPTSVINYCLEQLAQHFSVARPQEDPLLDDALEDTRRALQTLERMKIGRDTSELQSRENLVCRLLLEKKNH